MKEVICLQAAEGVFDSDFGPGSPSLNVDVERASRAQIEFEKETMPLMGSGKAVKGQGAVKAQIKKTPVKGKGPLMGNLVKSGRTYAQAVSGGATVDSDEFELVKSKNNRVGDLDSLGI